MRLAALRAKHEALLTLPNHPMESDNGIYTKYQNPIVTAAHTPLTWRYDFDEKDNPFLMQRIMMNATLNSGAIKWNGKYVLIVRVEGADRKSFFAVAESPNGIDNFRFWEEPIVMPDDVNPSEFFKDCFGIITNKNSAKRIVLRVEPTQAKYFRALPLHGSQQEEVHDNYSIFSYKMRITYDLKEEIMSHGASIEVLEPKELKTLIRTELENALKNYQ